MFMYQNIYALSDWRNSNIQQKSFALPPPPHKAEKGVQDFFTDMKSYFIIVSVFMPLVQQQNSAWS